MRATGFRTELEEFQLVYQPCAGVAYLMPKERMYGLEIHQYRNL